MKIYYVMAQKGLEQHIVRKAYSEPSAKMLKIAVTEELPKWNVFIVKVETSIEDIFERQWEWMIL